MKKSACRIKKTIIVKKKKKTTLNIVQNMLGIKGNIMCPTVTRL